MARAPGVQRQRKRDASETLDFGVYWLHVRERREGGGLIAAAASSPPPHTSYDSLRNFAWSF